MSTALSATRGAAESGGPKKSPRKRGRVEEKKKVAGVTVSLSNLNFETTIEELRAHIKETLSTGFGAVTLEKRKDGRSAGRATIAFRVSEDATKASQALQGKELGGRTITAKVKGLAAAAAAAQPAKKKKAAPAERPAKAVKKALTAEELDAEMDAYMNPKPPSSEAKKGKKTQEELDAELDAYMQPTATKDDDIEAELEEFKEEEAAADGEEEAAPAAQGEEEEAS